MTENKPISRMPPEIVEHMTIFHPYTLRRLTEVENTNMRFVHYTSADVGLKILDSGTVWMRQVSCMNDYSEVEHGLQCISNAWRGSHGLRLRTALDARFPGVVKEIEEQFNGVQNSLRFDTFVTSLSEHAGPGHDDEEQYGRLSMWRAYARGVGVALVIRNASLWTADTSLGLYTTPVAYLSDEAFAEELGIIAANIEARGDYLDRIGRDWLRHAVIMALSAAAVSTKHPGFREEREWRIVRTPNYPFPCPLQRVTQTVSNVPQTVLLLALKDDTSVGRVGIEPPALLDRIIIGPTDYPMPIYNAYLEQMKKSGIAEAEKKLKISFLPLRNSSA